MNTFKKDLVEQFWCSRNVYRRNIKIITEYTMHENKHFWTLAHTAKTKYLYEMSLHQRKQLDILLLHNMYTWLVIITDNLDFFFPIIIDEKRKRDLTTSTSIYLSLHKDINSLFLQHKFDFYPESNQQPLIIGYQKKINELRKKLVHHKNVFKIRFELLFQKVKVSLCEDVKREIWSFIDPINDIYS